MAKARRKSGKSATKRKGAKRSVKKAKTARKKARRRTAKPKRSLLQRAVSAIQETADLRKKLIGRESFED